MAQDWPHGTVQQSIYTGHSLNVRLHLFQDDVAILRQA